MDQSNRKRKGLGAKGKLAMMSFYRASTSKPPLPPVSTIHHHHCHHSTAAAGNVKPSPAGKQERAMMMTTTTATTKQRAAVGGGSGSSVEFIVNQEQVMSPQAKQGFSVFLPDSSSRANLVDSPYPYGGVAVDESVDMKASNYISTVRERIRLQAQTISSS